MNMKPNKHDVARFTSHVVSMFDSLADRYIESQHRDIAMSAGGRARQTISGVSSSQLAKQAYTAQQGKLNGQYSRVIDAPTAKVEYSQAASTQALPANVSSTGAVDYGTGYKGVERRHSSDRRNYGLRTLWRCLMDPRRYNGRRSVDRRFPLMDTFDSTAMCLAVALMILSITDAVLTLNILAAGGEEVNPFMNHMLSYGTFAFVASKMLMTALPLAALTAAGNLVIYNFVRVRTITATLVGLYCGLIVYELMILSAV